MIIAMYFKIIIIFISLNIIGLLFYKYINSQKNEALTQCKINLDKMCPTLKLSFKEKVCKIFTNKMIVERLSKEPGYVGPNGISIYPNKLINLTDGLMLGLGPYHENPNKISEYMLYKQIEPELDIILNDSNI